jgi:hypothetical protein
VEDRDSVGSEREETRRKSDERRVKIVRRFILAES